VKALFDTSVLVAGILTSHPRHTACFSQLKAAQSQDIQGFISTHTLAETYSVLTRIPVQSRVKPDQAQSLISELAQYLTVIPLIDDDYQTTIARMASLNLPGGGIFDALIAQAALKANVDVLFTLNPKHFTRLGTEISNLVKVPSQTE